MAKQCIHLLVKETWCADLQYPRHHPQTALVAGEHSSTLVHLRAQACREHFAVVVNIGSKGDGMQKHESLLMPLKLHLHAFQ